MATVLSTPPPRQTTFAADGTITRSQITQCNSDQTASIQTDGPVVSDFTGDGFADRPG
jgi:hypothetical protein